MKIPKARKIDKLGAKDFIIGFLVILAALVVVPFLILMFKISIYLAIIIGVVLAVILGVALLGRVIILLFRRTRSHDQHDHSV